MNKKKIISLVLGCMSLLPASAQNGWFVDVGGGVQTIFSSDASKLDFGKRLTPSYTIGVGKWITPANTSSISCNNQNDKKTRVNTNIYSI